MRLPSFSGRTNACPDLLKYSLDLRANVRLSPAMVVGELDDEEKVANGEVREGDSGRRGGKFDSPLRRRRRRR